MTAPDYRPTLHAAALAARAAGQMLRDEFHRSGGPNRIDVEVETLVHECLRAATPWNSLSTESGPIPGSDPSHCWVFTHDGTDSYLQGGAAARLRLPFSAGASRCWAWSMPSHGPTTTATCSPGPRGAVP